MKHSFCALVCLLFPLLLQAQAAIPYGDNSAVGKHIFINGVKLYYEAYGSGEPLILVHGNSTGIKGMKPQIEYFAKHYSVYAIDCRGRGKSELGKDSLTYIQQADDIAKFISIMKLDSVNILGKSDGGIVALLMGMYYPAHLKKLVAFGANLWPDSTALYPESVEEAKTNRRIADEMLAKKDTTKNWYLEQQKNRMMEFQPHISGKDLERIQVPVLVMSCDRDVIREEHTLFIYQHIPNANLSIFPGEVHRVPNQNAELFNSTVDKFLAQPFSGYSKRFSK